MSVILQPYQALPFNTSLDFQVSRQKGGSLCIFQNYIDSGTFLPFAILSPSETISNIEVYNCNDKWVQSLTLIINSTQDPETGLWFHYYNGDDIGLSCGTYYLTALVGELIWYSEQFTIKDIVNTSQYPELIKDDYHLPLRIYDSITKQLINKMDIACDVQPLNPVSTIMPFLFKTDEDINEINTTLVNTCTDEEIDLSADLELEFIKENPGGLIEQEILTTSQQLRSEFYEFDKRNYVLQEFKINDTGKLKNITFEWYFGNEEQTITVWLMQGIDPSTPYGIIQTITDNASTSKEITVDYSSFNYDVVAGEMYMLKFETNALCSGSIGVNSVKVYADGRFAERNMIGEFKDEILVSFLSNYYPPDFCWATFKKDSGNECFGSLSMPSEPGSYNYRYTANEAQTVRLRTSNITGILDGENDAPVQLVLSILKNDVEIYRDGIVKDYYYGFSLATKLLTITLNPGDNINIALAIYDPLGNIFNNSFATANISLAVYSNNAPIGINYLNKSLWFNVNVTKEVYEGGTGDTIIYNPARPLPSPLPCGTYYLKLISPTFTWYSEWFQVVNVGSIDLTQFVLGTEAGEIITNEDNNLFFEP